MDIIVTQIKQIGREILLDGNSVVGYQHSANLYVKLIKDTSADNPFANMALSAYCRGWKSRMPVSCPIVEKEDGTFILLKNEVFKEDGDVYLSLGGISEDKVIVTSNNLVLQVDESNSIIANVTPSEEYWQIEVLNAMKAWYANVVDPIFKDSETKLNQLIRRTEEHEEKAEELQAKAEEQQTQVDTAITNSETATESANAAANNANDKATLANDAAQAATQATTAAQTATQNANTATQAANDLVEDISIKLANGELNGKDGKDGKDGELGGDTVPIGAMLPCTTDVIPDGWLLCDGSLISRSEYSELFAVIGELYGAGDGETTFALPNEPNPLAYTREGVEVRLIDRNPPLHMIIKAKQVIPITGGIVNDQTSTSETDALSAAATQNLIKKHTTDLPEIIFGTTKMVKDETYTLNKSINRFRYILIMYAPLPSLHCMNTMLVPVRFIDMNASTASNQFNMHCRISEESFAYSQIGFVNETTLKAQTASGTGKYPDVYVKICGIR